MVFGPRFLIQAGLIIAVAVVAGIADVGTWSIIGLVAGAWILVALVEIGLWYRNATRRRRVVAPPVAEPEPEPPVAIRAEPVPTPEPPLIAAAPPPPEPEVEPAAERPVRAERGPVEGVRGNREVPSTTAEEPEPAVAYLPLSREPREWNLWELERAVRDHAGDDVVRSEERAYLLVYLREFAGPDGTLPADFDGLVRDAFGDLIGAVAT